MSFDAQSVYELLPAVYRVRDAGLGEPLKALLSVVAEQLEVLEEDLDQLYDDQFIETCAEWAIPYIGDAIGYRPLNGAVPGVRSPRGEVAKTIGLRRHKGTAAMLEVLASEVTGWDAKVVEFFQLLAVTQYMKCLRPGATLPDLRRWEPLEHIGTAFEGLRHTADVRRISTGGGRFNIPNVGVHLWRLGAYSRSGSRAMPLIGQIVPSRMLFSPLGNSAPLFTRPHGLGSIDEFTERSGSLNLPLPISRRAARENPDYFYGSAGSLQILEYVDLATGLLVPAPTGVRICNLSNLPGGSGAWANMPGGSDIAVDPVLGRIGFGPSIVPAAVSVNFQSGFSMDLGGGEYDRSEAIEGWHQPSQVIWQLGVDRKADGSDPQFVSAPSLALAAWDAFVTTGPPAGLGVIVVTDSWAYGDPLNITVPAGFTLAIVAAEWPADPSGNRQTGDLSAAGCFPTILSDVQVFGTGASSPASPGTLILDGLLIKGSVTVGSTGTGLGRLLFNHTTVVPWTTLDSDVLPLSTTAPRVVNQDGGCDIEADHSILGAIRSPSSTRFTMTSCIVDSTDPTHVAFAGPVGVGPGSTLHMVNTTVIGKVRTREMELASNCLFLAGLANPDPDWSSPVRAERRQAGCVRFCSVPEGSRLPRRYRCQPDLGMQELVEKGGLHSIGELPADVAARELARLVPVFSSLRYGDPSYAQLGRRCAPEISTGADDGSEMGAFHDLFQPQRDRNLQVRLNEYLRFGLEAGIFYET